MIVMFPKAIKARLKKLINAADAAQRKSELAKCLSDSASFLDTPYAAHLITNLKNQEKDKYRRLLVLRDTIEKIYDELEEDIRLNYTNSAALGVINMPKVATAYNLDTFLILRQDVLKNALRHIFFEELSEDNLLSKNNTIGSSLRMLLYGDRQLDPDYERILDNYVERTEVITFRQEYIAYLRIKQLLEYVHYIRAHSMGVSNASICSIVSKK